MIDAILYVPDFPALVAHLDAHYPDLLERDEYGSISQPPVVTGFARTPAVVNGDALMVYARLREDEAEQWRGMTSVEVLAEAAYTGDGQATADLVYDALFSASEAKTAYDSVYSAASFDVDDGEGGTITITPPERFGQMA